MDKFDAVIIGGGPAGLMAAAVAAQRGRNVLLIDKNRLLAKKLRITGKGRCNITNAADIPDLILNVVTNSSFLYSAFYTFTNENTIRLFNSLGVETKVERGGRVFPQSDSAKEVADSLVSYAKKSGAAIISGCAKDILISDGKVFGVALSSGEEIYAESVLIATGGVSYPLTGSTGDGYKFAEKAGHKIIPPKPSLVPLNTKEAWVKDVMGLSLKNVEITLKKENKVLYKDFGEMLFTHFGVSGPVVLSSSAHIKNTDGEFTLIIDLKPALTFEQLDRRIQRDFQKFINKNFSNALVELLPKKLIPVIVELSGISPELKVNQISKEQRKSLAYLLKNLPLSITGARPIEEAIITSGGVCVKEINPSTMESRLAKGLFFAGEVIDCDAYTGGYNLQIAFSTGYLAGENI
ncbi:MAG: NAD(P)/FAD-dependent oxidoreductase [Eubacteriales bacterium]|nr:NAD(P)/FAD-dependent oxidoreductase [Eubacteriales bacterium]